MPAWDKQYSVKLWKAFLEGDNNNFAAFYFYHIDRLISYGKKITDDDEMLRDAIQEVFTDLFEKRAKKHTEVENPAAYLMVALRNNIYKKKDALRKSAGHSLHPDQVVEFNVEYSFQDLLIRDEIQKETLERLRAAINKLTSGQKELIYLRFEEGLNYPEIAELMKINIESARKQLYRAILSLKKILDSYTFQILFLHFFSKKVCP